MVWTPVDPSLAADIDDKFGEEAPIQDPSNAAVAIKPPRKPSGPTHASRRTLWRDDAWLPQITSIIPNGFGPSGLMLELSATGTDCTLGKGPCEPFISFEAWQDSITKQANGEIYGTIGIGNSQKGLGSFLITNSFEQVAAEVRNSSLSSTPLTGLQTGLHYARALGPDTSLRTGIENLITWDEKDYIYADMTRNVYAVASQRIRLKTDDDPNPWLRNLYLTGGLGNGEFKPIEETFQDQTQALKKAGCATYGFEPANPCSFERFKRALRTGSDYGTMHPIGAIALETYPNFHLITEWTGRNLNAGFSFKPFNDFGLVITPMLNSLIKNCEYPGCKVTPIPGYDEKVELPDVVLTERPRLSIQATLNIKF